MLLSQLLFVKYVISHIYSSQVYAFYKGEVRLDDFGNKFEKKGQQGTERKKINAVLFFADTLAGEDYQNSSGLDYLKLEKKPKIKHCTDYPTGVLSRWKRQWRFKKHTCSCYNRLQEGIMALLNYAQNELGMVTALGSLANHSFSNSIRFGNTETGEKRPEETVKKGPENEENPANSLSDIEEEQLRRIPLLNVFPKDSPPPFYAFNDEEERKKRSEGPYVLEPEHTEIFKIRSRRDIPTNKPEEISDAAYLNREQQVQAVFDLMDIMNIWQKSLFGNKLQDDSDTYCHDGEVCSQWHNLLRKIRQPGLFEVVHKTLYNVINSSETGFLMVIIGGNMSDISSAYSPLVQSIKHVSENTDQNSTLIVLAGTCPNSPDAQVKLSCEELSKMNLPLFADGPGSEEFAQCYELYDVPLTVRRILSKFNSKIREAQPQDMEIPLHPRAKRRIIDLEFDDDDEDEEEEYDVDREVHWETKRAAHSSSGGRREKMKNGGSSIFIQNPGYLVVPCIFYIYTFIYIALIIHV